MPEKRNGVFLKQHVVAKVCAKSGSFTKSWKNFFVFFLLLRIIIPSVMNSVVTPRSVNKLTKFESPCKLFLVNPLRVISEPGISDAISYQYDAADQSASTTNSSAIYF